jgi:U3 small nucleolar RNA-associated protein 14
MNDRPRDADLMDTARRNLRLVAEESRRDVAELDQPLCGDTLDINRGREVLQDVEAAALRLLDEL